MLLLHFVVILFLSVYKFSEICAYFTSGFIYQKLLLILIIPCVKAETYYLDEKPITDLSKFERVYLDCIRGALVGVFEDADMEQFTDPRTE